MCKCEEKKGVLNPSVATKKAVVCIGCSESLPDLKGKLRPVHQIPVSVSQEQITKWIEDGHDIQEI